VDHVLFLESGFVKLNRRNREGVSRTYGLYGPGDSLGMYALWAGVNYPTDAVALNEGLRVIRVESAAIVKFAEKYPRLSVPLRNELTRFTNALINKIEIVSAGAASERVAALFMQLIDRYGVEKEGRCARLPLTLTLDQISEIVGVRMETVARVVSEWKREGWLRIDSHGCHFADLDKMREVLPE
jgi:CRP/FNR family transcriptional regulator